MNIQKSAKPPHNSFCTGYRKGINEDETVKLIYEDGLSELRERWRLKRWWLTKLMTFSDSERTVEKIKGNYESVYGYGESKIRRYGKIKLVVLV